MTGVLGSTIVATAALADTIRIFWGMSLFWFFGITLYVGIILDNQRQEKKNKVREYETKYGSLTTNSNSLNNYPWGWIDEPWPWEG